MYYIIVTPPAINASVISLIAKTVYEAHCLVEYYTKLCCLVNIEGVN